MLEQTALDAALSNHDNEMSLCHSRRCDWALLHLILAYPDICSGLEVANPDEKIGSRYKGWCDRFLATPHLTGTEWWAMRNAVLHQGSATIKRGTRYSRFEFAVTTPPDHARVQGDVLHLDVVRLAAEMNRAVMAWKAWLLSTPPPPEAVTIEQSLGRVAAIYLAPADQAMPATAPGTPPSTAGAPYAVAPGDGTTAAPPFFTPMKSKRMVA